MEAEITSSSNPTFKYLKSFARSRNRKKEGKFLMEGRPELDIAVAQGFSPELIVYCEKYMGITEINEVIDSRNVKSIRLSPGLFDQLSYQHVPGNFMALMASKDYDLADLNGSHPLIVLEGIEKPGNLGAILRTCDGAGIEEVLVTECEMDLYNPNILRNSRGAAFTVKCVFCSNEEAKEFMRQKKLVPTAAVLSDASVDFRSVNSALNRALIFGAEDTGLSDYWLRESDEHIIIPMLGVVDSLNVSVSAAVVLHHFLKTQK